MSPSFLSAGLDPLSAVLDNGALWWGLAACGLAQLSKLVIELVVHRRWNPKVLIETGGMPSSHSALITGTTACIGWQLGFDSPLFALAATLCFIVLYDASGVRRNAGLIAARVNALPQGLWSMEADPAPNDDAAASAAASPRQPLKETLGHTRLEVLVGSLIGPAIALPGLVWVGTPLHLATTWGLIAPIGS
ncbi:divergent PAP2 family protein [Synechococcus sp. FGCU-3]|nr:divergent PAP2 family protein [Synechococcus sp. FGCU3]